MTRKSDKLCQQLIVDCSCALAKLPRPLSYEAGPSESLIKLFLF